MIRDVILFLMKIEPKSILNKWGGAILGLVRGSLIAGILSLFLLMSTVPYFVNSARNSANAKVFLKFILESYKFSSDRLFQYFFPEGQINTEVFEIFQKK